MTVKELKAILDTMNDNTEVMILDPKTKTSLGTKYTSNIEVNKGSLTNKLFLKARG